MRCVATARSAIAPSTRTPWCDRATCVIKNSRIDGNIKVGTRADLRISGSRVDDDIQSKNHRWVIATNTTTNTTVDGNVQLERGQSATVNRVDGNLQCKSNRNALTGGRNIVEGNKEGQCRRL